MKDRITILLVIIAILFTEACTSSFVYKRFKSEYVLPSEKGKIVLDSTYSFYVRSVTSSEQDVAGSGAKQRVLSLSETGSLKGGFNTSSEKIIEIEYLWISRFQHTVLYVSTVADRFQNRYSDSSFLGLDKPNVADFRILLIGKVDTDRVVFYGRDGKHTDTWTIRDNGSEIVLQVIEQKSYGELEEAFLVDDAVHNPVVFKKLGNWKLMFLDKEDKVLKHAVPLADNNVHYASAGNRIGLMFDFTDCKVAFPERHVIYTPERKIPEKN
jgi:hypothetical protein